MTEPKSPEQMLDEAWNSIDASDAPLDVRLSKFVDRARELVPWLMTAYDSFIDRIAQAGTGDDTPSIGDPMPNFVLPDLNGRMVSLHDLIQKGPLIVSFNRGQWCEFCRMEVRALAKAHEELIASGAQIVSIVPEKGNFAADMVEANALPFKVLIDVDLGYALSLGLAVWAGHEIKDLYENKMDINLALRQGNKAWLLPIPATMIVGVDGCILANHIDPDFRHRMTVDAIRSALQSV